MIALSKIILEKHNGVTPRTREDLVALPGVGHKTASVVLNEAYGEATIAVDTHVFRVSNRTGLAAAIYLAAFVQAGTDRAGQQLSVRYGHVAVPYRPETSAMDRSWERFRKLSVLPKNGE